MIDSDNLWMNKYLALRKAIKENRNLDKVLEYLEWVESDTSREEIENTINGFGGIKECIHQWEEAVPNPYGFVSACKICRTPTAERKH